MPNKMLIDASHPEETRVVVTRGNKVEEFDFESASRRQLRGNIYLAKVTRVEPSLQAAFIEYGGNRHGFLAFSEIHPDYYQIPVADRQALLEDDARAEREQEREAERPRGRRRRGASRRHQDRNATISAPAEELERPLDDERADAAHGGADEQDDARTDRGEGPAPEDSAPFAGEEHASEVELPAGSDGQDAVAATEVAESALPPEPQDSEPARAASGDQPEPDADERAHNLSPDDAETLAEASAPFEDDHSETVDDEADEEDDEEEEDELEEHEIIEHVGGGDALEDVPERPRVHRRNYKIQEVIKRRQILLVQVVKEERGNKGAALTTYLSLAGRYAVLMPNTGKGGGISRKITSAEDRKRLKEVVQDLEVPEGMGIILRTAGASRTKPEIKRDFEYLMRLWESVRELTLGSSAPALVYEEGSLIKRAIRDLYNKDIDDVIVSGEEGYREAKDFMRMIMPTQAKVVQPYRETQPLFAQHGVEAQLDAMFSSHVTLKSGGYLVINPTEALVSIDVNSGRSTREHNIEDTALRTNLEASEEIARQLRLRDLAGLIVIDFIDMEEKRNNRAVEKKLKDCLKNDRARIQVGRISPFGLLEMSRQRIRTGVLESSSIVCQACGGSGTVRSTPSVALQVLRSIEEALLRSTTHNLVVRTRVEAAFYILNQKRAHLREIETRFGVTVSIMPDESLSGTTTFAIDRGELATPAERPAATGVRMESFTPVDEPIEVDPTAEFEREDEEDHEGAGVESAAEPNGEPREGEGETDENGRRRRRRRRRRGRGAPRELEGASAEQGETDEDDEESEDGASTGAAQLLPQAASNGSTEAAETGEAEVIERPRRYTDGASSMASPASGGDIERSRPDAATDIEASPDPDRDTLAETAAALPPQPVPQPLPEPEPEPVAVVLTPPDPDRPKRGGWWSKAKAALSGS
ncbi:MAG: ribonuclease [Enterovirga sp.]|nr:ribonuclease [Enterovirga sp.]